MLLSKLTTLDLTTMGWLGCKVLTQNKQTAQEKYELVDWLALHDHNSVDWTIILQSYQIKRSNSSSSHARLVFTSLSSFHFSKSPKISNTFIFISCLSLPKFCCLYRVEWQTVQTLILQEQWCLGLIIYVILLDKLVDVILGKLLPIMLFFLLFCWLDL